MDPTAREIGTPGQPGWQRLGSKVLIDATKPPLNDPEHRRQFERIQPPNGTRVRLEDYLLPRGRRVVSCAFSMIGDFFAKYAIARAGIYVPIMPAGPT